jgi:DNA helicase-2/ATP-dependent DNA helicase PcrA
MTIAPSLMKWSYPLNEEQRAIISHKHGPLLVVAGPGSGKTLSLILLAMNLLLCDEAKPSELILCTYTEKAACDMQDRLLKIASDVGYQQDLALLRIGTIHSICKQLISENKHYLRIENDFITLDQFTRQLLIFEEIDKICSTLPMKRFFQKYWGSPWQLAKELGSSFDRITEELLFGELRSIYAGKQLSSKASDNDRLCYYLTGAYFNYQNILTQKNCLDFAHLQKCVYNLLSSSETFPLLTQGIRYVLVDEYQDTNYIQEQILTRLATATGSNNLFVVGDEDQALYRFRGATVRNLLEFEEKNPGYEKIMLMANYRSHQNIIGTCNTWISSIDWSNSQDRPFRTDKNTCPPLHRQYKDYAAVCTMTHKNIDEEAEQFADLVVTLKQQGKIQDYSQVALLLYSVKPAYSALFMQALEKKNILSFCPRALSYFNHEEVCLLLGCFAHILACEQDPASIGDDDAFPDYLQTCRKQLKQALLLHNNLRSLLFHMREEIAQQGQEAQGKPLLDYFYRLVTVSPFLVSLKGARNQEAQPRNLEMLSEILQTFQRYYRYTGITQQNQRDIARDFFQRFLPLLYSNGLNDDDVSPQPFPEGQVPILTIHQAKGLEFPVVVVGRLDKIFASSINQRQKALQKFSPRLPFEPEDRISEFDLRRLYYVAFSRAKSLLVLMAVKKPDPFFTSLWHSLPSWSQIDIKNMPTSEKREQPVALRPHYGLTNDIQLYTTCPRQFQFFRAYNFTSSRNGRYFSGQLVHHTLEHIHRMARDGKLEDMNEEALSQIFERKFQALIQSYAFPIDSSQKSHAWQQVLRYFLQNRETLHHVEAAELSIQMDKQRYILTGTIDLLVKTPAGLDLIDFKTLPRPRKNAFFLEEYEQQLHFYASAMEQSRGQRPERLFLYWTAEERKEDALMEIPYQPEKVKKMKDDLESVVENIQAANFHVRQPPDIGICQRCDIRYLCKQDRVIEI